MNDQVSFEVDAVEEQSKAYAVTERKWIARSPTLTVMEFTLAPNEEVPLHHHSDTYDIFYCIEGSMRVECIDVKTGKQYPEQILNVGDSAKVPAGIAHRPFNPGPERCRFVIIQGFKKKDFLLYDKSKQ